MRHPDADAGYERATLEAEMLRRGGNTRDRRWAEYAQRVRSLPDEMVTEWARVLGLPGVEPYPVRTSCATCEARPGSVVTVLAFPGGSKGSLRDLPRRVGRDHAVASDRR